MSDNKNDLTRDAAISHGRVISPPNLEINSYMQTPTIRPTAATTQQATSQTAPQSSEKK